MSDHEKVRRYLDHLGDGDDGNMHNYAAEVQDAYDELERMATLRDEHNQALVAGNEALRAEIERLRETMGMLAFEVRWFLRNADYTVERAQEEALLSFLHDAELLVDD